MEAGDSAGLVSASFQVAPGTDLGDVQKALSKHGVAGEIRSCFSLEPRDISAHDLRERPLALPRYDCIEFPHGTSRVGPERG